MGSAEYTRVFEEARGLVKEAGVGSKFIGGLFSPFAHAGQAKAFSKQLSNRAPWMKHIPGAEDEALRMRNPLRKMKDSLFGMTDKSMQKTVGEYNAHLNINKSDEVLDAVAAYNKTRNMQIAGGGLAAAGVGATGASVYTGSQPVQQNNGGYYAY